MNHQAPKESYPLSWPERWPRTSLHMRQESRFTRPVRFGSNRRHTIEDARRFLADEIDRLNGTDAILSTNLRLRLDGNPISGQAQPSDVGVAVYFKLKGKDVALACDKWRHVECNIYAIAKHVEALRGQQRWGVGNIDQAFRGYMAIPEKAGGLSWWEILGVTCNASEDQIRDAYHAKAKIYHPDVEGGDLNKMTELNEAYRMATSNIKS